MALYSNQFHDTLARWETYDDRPHEADLNRQIDEYVAKTEAVTRGDIEPTSEEAAEYRSVSDRMFKVLEKHGLLPDGMKSFDNDVDLEPKGTGRAIDMGAKG